MKNYIPLILPFLFLIKSEVPHGKYNIDIHPAKINAAIESGVVYDAKQRERERAEADFWQRNYAESARSQRVWEQKQRNTPINKP